MQFTDTAEVAGTRRTADGYLVASVLCARTGCQDYLGKELGLMDADVVSVHRPREVVFDRKSMETYVGKPVTIDHPAESVTSENWKDLAVGDILAVVPEGEYIRADIKVMDAAAIVEIEGGKREISMGYDVGIEFKDGIDPEGTPFQAEIKGPLKINHLAIVDRARGGTKLRIGDDDGGKARQPWGASPLTDADRKDNPMNLRKILVDGLQVETTEAGEQAINKLQSQLTDAQTALTKANEDHQTAINAKDAELGKKDAEIDKLKGTQLSDADLDAKVEARAALVDAARLVDKDIETKGLSDADIRKAIVAKQLGDKIIDGKPDAYIEARFDAIVVEAKKDDPVAKQFVDGKSQPTGDLDKAYADRNRGLQDAWKTPKED